MAVKFYLPDGTQTDIVALSPALLLRAHARGLPRVHAGAQARPGDGRARHGEGRRLASTPRRCPRSRPRCSATRRRATPPASTTRPLVPLDRRRRRLALGALPLRARGRRADPRIEEAKARGPRLPPGGRSWARASAPSGWWSIIAEDGDPRRPDRRLAGRARARGGRPPGADRPRDRARAGRRRAGLRPHAGDRRHRAERRPDPALPPASLRGCRWRAGRSGG